MPAQACKYLQEKITKLVNEIKQVKETMESEIAQVKETMDNEITQVKETMENEITQVKETMENEITQVKETMEKEIKEVKETMETLKQTMDKEINRRVKEEITTLMIDVNQKLKILEKDSASKSADPTKTFKCSECEWWGKTGAVVKTHIKKKHS